ncbi:MAG: hypothetical protein QM692_09290 [Thermomicrobiales bacterium]
MASDKPEYVVKLSPPEAEDILSIVRSYSLMMGRATGGAQRAEKAMRYVALLDQRLNDVTDAVIARVEANDHA